jgi:hypothetical protein
MSISRSILIKSIVKPFYQRHAGLFVMVFVLMFGIVSILHGAKFTDYHFFLIKGILNNPFLFALVLILWLLYIKKTEQFTLNTLRRREYTFLHLLSVTEKKKLYSLLIGMQFLLIIPVLLYVAIMLPTGIYLHAFMGCIIIVIFLITGVIASSRAYMNAILNPEELTTLKRVVCLNLKSMPYWSFFIRFITKEKKLLFAGIKIYSCVVLYEMIVNQTRILYDLRMILIFYSLGLLGHGLLIYQLRDMEESRLVFYRTIPRSLINRFGQYGMICLILLIPEFITIAYLTPVYLHTGDAVLFMFFSFTLILFLNCLLFIQLFRSKDYLKIILCLFFLIYFCVLSSSVGWLCISLFISSFVIFFTRYYRFERKGMLSG